MPRSARTNLEQKDTPRAFLDEVYQSLHYEDGALLTAAQLPDEYSKNEWIDKGDWLSLASEIGAEKVFFVNNDPVIVFCTQQDADPQKLLDLFRRYWSMSRPQCLFLALPGELRVYSLNQDPAKNVETWQNVKPLQVVRQAADVSEVLQAYRREMVETGRLFQEERFGDIEQRADKRLIQDLKLVRQELLKTGLKPRYAHALIGRSIFIRYLEDRGILTSAYFEEVAAQNPEWQALFSSQSEQVIISSNSQEQWYERVLKDKAFTYALFEKLAQRFNGDMFPRDGQEEIEVEQRHLNLLRGFLLGDANPQQPPLFLWAYDFKIVPTGLISSIYEEFYHDTNTKNDKGTHYTPNVLVDYVLSQVLNESILAANPRILDPACGSGIFLVEAFRRIVRYKVQQLGRHLDSGELRQILQTQVVGIEIDSEAVHVAAFSLYLALLHYQEPPDILQNPRLPNLIFRSGQTEDVDNFGILFHNNAFNLTDTEMTVLREKLENQPRFQGRAELQRFLKISHTLPINEHSFDIVVGNPPWGASKDKSIEVQENWRKAVGWPVGDREPSQAFIGRALTLLKPGGACGFLVTTGVLLKHGANSEEFRTRWLEECTIKTVVNFGNVRHIFFNAADSSFAFVHFTAEQPAQYHKIRYWSAKRTDMVDQLQVIILSLPDLKQVEQRELLKRPYLWKVYWWGSHRDAALINILSLDTRLGEFLEERLGVPLRFVSHRGFKSGSEKSSAWLTDFKELPINLFRRYGAIDLNQLITAPDKVLHYGSRDIYEGSRILFKRNPSDEDSSGRLVARLEETDYCFSSSIVGFPVSRASDWERKILIGILWSSLARYFLFLITSGWGLYHYEVLQIELMSLPIHFPEQSALRDQIIGIVDKLLAWKYDDADTLLRSASQADLESLEKQLDTAIFELYGLSQSERNLIEDMCNIGFQLLYRKTSKLATARVSLLTARPEGTIDDLTVTSSNDVSLQNYLYTFLQVWNRELEPDGEFSWRIIRADHAPMMAIVFTTQEKGESISQNDEDTSSAWNKVLEQCAAALRQPVSQRIYIDSMIRAVTDTEIYIVKRDERRLWTRSMAREDAEATMLQAILLQQQTETL